MKYKVGDKVRIRSDLVVNEVYGGLIWLDGSMSCLAGKILTVEEVYKNDCYSFEETIYSLSEEMIKGLADSIEVAAEPNNPVNHPSHYNLHKYECIEEMIAVFGVEDVKTFCKLNVWKYRYRHTGKNGQQDLDKADEYMTILMNLESEE